MAEQGRDKPDPERKYICWNCGSMEHRLSDCDKEIRQENKTFWRKYFRRYDKKEKNRHQRRYVKFLKARPSVKQDPDGQNDETPGTSSAPGPAPGNPEFWEKHRQFVEEQRMKANSQNQMNDNVMAQFQAESNGKITDQAQPGSRNEESGAESSARARRAAESDFESSSSCFETDSE